LEASLLYSIPAVGDAGQDIQIRLALSQFPLDTSKNVFIFSPPGVEASLIDYEQSDQTEVTEVTILLKSKTFGPLNLEVAPCSIKSNCANKVVPISFTFLDPQKTRAESFLPMTETTYGGTQMKVKIRNLNTTTDTGQVMVEILENITATDIECFASGFCNVIAVIPRSRSLDSTQLVNLKVHLLKQKITLHFDTPFMYLAAPRPIVTRIIPTYASITASSTVRVSVKNFPFVTSATQIQVLFRWGTQSVSAMVKDFVFCGQGSSGETNVDIQSPMGTNVLAGKPSIVIFHRSFGESHSAEFRDGFVMVNPLNPQISRMRGPNGIDVNELSLPMSASSEITITIDNSPRLIEVDPATYIVQVGDAVLDITSANINGRQARIITNTFRQQSPDSQYGIVAFGQECSSACCLDMTCSKACPSVKTVCFVLNFYDDTLPILTVESDQTGPRVGGDIVRLTISNFPYDEVSVYYMRVGNVQRVYIDQFSLASKGADAKSVIINTPQFVDFVGDERVDIVLESAVDASKSVRFSYLVEDVRPAVVSKNPVQGIAGTKILVRVEYFEYPTQVFIRINDGNPLPDDKVTILPMSNKHLTLINFEWVTSPAGSAGMHVVKISPQSCPEPCDKSVRFSFEELDASRPELILPIPRRGSYHQVNLPIVFWA